MFKYLVYKFGQFCVTHLPLAWSYRLAMFLSDLHYFFSFRDRRAVRNNLKIILGSEENVKPLCREVFRNFGKYLVEFFRMAHVIDQRFVQEHVKIENLEVVDEVLKRGKGAIFLTAHIGNWELGGVILATLGYPIMAIALPHKERPVNDLFNKQRESRGVRIVPTSLAVRRCLETLRNNQVVAVLADRDFTQNGEILSFLGKAAFIPKGAALLAAKTGAGIIPSFLLRDKDDTFILSIGEPIYAPSEMNGEVPQETLLAIMKQYAEVMEEKIKAHPTQWLMFREFWAAAASIKEIS